MAWHTVRSDGRIFEINIYGPGDDLQVIEARFIDNGPEDEALLDELVECLDLADVVSR